MQFGAKQGCRIQIPTQTRVGMLPPVVEDKDWNEEERSSLTHFTPCTLDFIHQFIQRGCATRDESNIVADLGEEATVKLQRSFSQRSSA